MAPIEEESHLNMDSERRQEKQDDGVERRAMLIANRIVYSI